MPLKSPLWIQFSHGTDVGNGICFVYEVNMNIVYAMTRNVYYKAIPSMKSLIEHNPDAKIYILAEDDEIENLPCKATVINVSGQTIFPKSGPNYRNWFTYINLLKVCYPSLLKCAKVIHLDIDTIICGSLKPLWDTDVKGKWFAAVPEYTGKYKPFGETYYNMGIALINLTQMRKDKIEPDMAEYLNTVKQPWADQDAWNKYGIEQDKAVALDVKYNESNVTGKTDEPVIVHYCGISDWYERRNMDRREYLDRYL